ncbi:2-C-methyl-D-erythritol 4-phosphate cytidylyltransferase [Ottowia sp. GY511]|uniref:2-C-methyl-D-erythritol 4-phosphate cytidylyltransferase n=1 Tax=Ottowia flava TaxID=2675430 RepID=A0ABW4KXN5_9BURK|nr:2-C-methyl-D-erythritol 4-phosphate cytidylyltransferase [Ottowia sp. GY511]TXK26297.1 2-C-methyl-D-erythritol 4-phosphate cytidylyltransferase [Ottowia sp. GY511]
MNAPKSTPTAARCYALLPCAGTGSRAGTAQPKQYQPVAGVPMVQHTLTAFAQVARLAGVLVVVAPGDGVLTSDAAARRTVAPCGGATRAESVLNGLNHLLAHGAAPGDWVLVHDAARCLVTPAQIDALIDACLPDAVGGLLALPLPDTLKAEAGGRVAATVDRSDKWLAQTPQMFRIGALRDAYAAQAASGFAGFAGLTDEASAIEATGAQPLLVRGSAQNFKVTYPEDFALAEAILRSRNA